MYLLINADQSINFVGEHPIDQRLCFKGVTLLELPDGCVADVMGDIPLEQALWDQHQACVIRDPALTLNLSHAQEAS